MNKHDSKGLIGAKTATASHVVAEGLVHVDHMVNRVLAVVSPSIHLPQSMDDEDTLLQTVVSQDPSEATAARSPSLTVNQAPHANLLRRCASSTDPLKPVPRVGNTRLKDHSTDCSHTAYSSFPLLSHTE